MTDLEIEEKLHYASITMFQPSGIRTRRKKRKPARGHRVQGETCNVPAIHGHGYGASVVAELARRANVRQRKLRQICKGKGK